MNALLTFISLVFLILSIGELKGEFVVGFIIAYICQYVEAIKFAKAIQYLTQKKTTAKQTMTLFEELSLALPEINFQIKSLRTLPSCKKMFEAQEKFEYDKQEDHSPVAELDE